MWEFGPQRITYPTFRLKGKRERPADSDFTIDLMTGRSHTGRDEARKERRASETEVVDLADARVRLRSRSRSNVSRESLLGELEAVRLLLDQGLSSEVKTRLAPVISATRHEPSLLAQARCSL